MFWKDMKLRNKLYFGFCTVLIILLVLSFLSYSGIGQIKQQAQDVVRSNQIDGLLAQKEIDHLNWFIKVTQLWTNPDTLSIEVQTNDHECDFGKWLYGNERKKLELIYPDLSELIKEIEAPHNQLHSSILEINEIMSKYSDKDEGLTAADAILYQKTIPALSQVQDIMHNIRESVKEKIITDDAMIKNVQNTRSRVLIISMAAIVIALLLAFIISSSISRPIIAAIKFAEKMAQGDFTNELPIKQKDEVGLLSNALNLLVTNLRRMFREINNSAYTLNASSMNLSSISEQMKQGAKQNSVRASTVATAAEEMSANMNNVAAASEEASTNVNLVATSSEEMSSTINEIAKNTEQARIITENAVSQTEEASSKVDELGAAANDINRVTESITEISEQTNLLALNATIEAARAGEAGKGFAVVANEIKELAKQTAEATLDIKAKIGGIQSSTNITISKIKDITKINKEVSEIVTTIANAVEEQSVATQEIANNVTQASQGIQEVNENVTQSSTVANDISKEIAGVKISTDEITTSSLQIEVSAQDLLKIAKLQTKAINQYKIPEARFDIETVKGAHLQWRSRLEGLLHGKQSLKPEEVTSHHECDFGKWFDSSDGQELKGFPVFSQVGQHHEKVHSYAKQIVELVHNGDTERASGLMDEFEKERGKMFEALNELYLI